MPAQARSASPTGVPVTEKGTAATQARNNAFHHATRGRSPWKRHWIQAVAKRTERNDSGMVTTISGGAANSSRFQRLSTPISTRADMTWNGALRAPLGASPWEVSRAEGGTAAPGASGGRTSGMRVGGRSGGFAMRSPMTQSQGVGNGTTPERLDPGPGTHRTPPAQPATEYRTQLAV